MPPRHRTIRVRHIGKKADAAAKITQDLIRLAPGNQIFLIALHKLLQLVRFLGKSFHDADAAQTFFRLRANLRILHPVLPESFLHLLINPHRMDGLKD
jgi:hypothetical protein